MDIDRLAGLESPTRSLISIYLNRPPGPSAAALTDLLKPIRTEMDHLERPVAMSLRADAERIAGLDARIDSDPSPAFFILASHADGIFELSPLDGPVWDHVSFGRRPYLRPLRALPEPISAGVAVVERRHALVYRAERSTLTHLGDEITGELGKDNYGGFRGYEEHRVRGHAEEESARVQKEAAARLFRAHQQRPLDLISVGGHQQTIDDLVRHLHPYLLRLPIHRFVIDLHTMTDAELRDRVADHAALVRASRDENAVRAVLEANASGIPSAMGTASVLEACNAKAIDQLVVAGTFTKPGVACPECGWLGRVGSPCPVCGSEVDPTDDVIAAAMEATVASGGEVRQVEIASQLDAEGVGAVLRYPI